MSAEDRLAERVEAAIERAVNGKTALVYGGGARATFAIQVSDEVANRLVDAIIDGTIPLTIAGDMTFAKVERVVVRGDASITADSVRAPIVAAP